MGRVHESRKLNSAHEQGHVCPYQARYTLTFRKNKHENDNDDNDDGDYDLQLLIAVQLIVIC